MLPLKLRDTTVNYTAPFPRKHADKNSVWNGKTLPLNWRARPKCTRSEKLVARSAMCWSKERRSRLDGECAMCSRWHVNAGRAEGDADSWSDEA